MRTATAAVIACLFALTACGSDSAPTAANKPTATPSPTARWEDKFLAAIEDADIPSWSETPPPDSELLDFPTKWCSELEAGHSVEYLFGMDGANLYPVGLEWGTEKTDAYEVLVIGVTAHCPQYRDQVTKELREVGAY